MPSAKGVVRGCTRALFRFVTTLAARLRPGATRRPPADRNVLDDLAARRPWNLAVKLARTRARLRRRPSEGVTVVIVNWNTKDVVSDVVRCVQRFSSPRVKVLVVDNGSTDGSAEHFRRWDGIDSMVLPSNAGHGVALDLAVCRCTTTVAVTLDSDAVPLRADWLDQVVGPVRSGDAVLAGHRSSRDFVHPVFAAIDTATFLDRRLSFQVHRDHGEGRPDEWGVNAWDTGELLTHSLDRDQVHFVEESPTPEGLPGISSGGAVYHFGGLSRASSGGVSDAAYERWRSALETLGVIG